MNVDFAYFIHALKCLGGFSPSKFAFRCIFWQIDAAEIIFKPHMHSSKLAIKAWRLNSRFGQKTASSVNFNSKFAPFSNDNLSCGDAILFRCHVKKWTKQKTSIIDCDASDMEKALERYDEAFYIRFMSLWCS